MLAEYGSGYLLGAHVVLKRNEPMDSSDKVEERFSIIVSKCVLGISPKNTFPIKIVRIVLTSGKNSC